jgi:hypothetical protein
MRVKLRRAALAANIVVLGTTLPVALLPVTTPNSSAALPLYQFVNSGSGPLPWNAVSFENSINNTKMLGNPHAASSNGEEALTYRMANSQIGLYVQNASGTSSWTDLSTLVASPTPASDPVPFFDPAGNLDIVYVATNNHVILITPTSTRFARSDHVTGAYSYHPFVATDLSLASGVNAAVGLPSVGINGLSGFVAIRSTTNAAIVIPLTWHYGQNTPSALSPVNVSSTTGVTAISNDPVAVVGGVNAFAATSSTGKVELFVNAPSSTAWSVENLSALTGAPSSAGALAVTHSTLSTYISALSVNGNVELFTTSVGFTNATSPWSYANVTATTSGAPPLDGAIYMNATATQLFIAGQAANWGDLFVFNNSLGATTWTSTDVSVTAGASARSVGPGVTGFTLGAAFELFAAGVSSPPPQGVGVYAIPTKYWGKAITDGWPVISETGGLGTNAAPWVGYVTATSVATSPDYLLGQSIYNSHKRVTWLSFWTVSGPLANETKSTTTYYNHGFAAGVWVAQQIDQYRALGVGLKPDWVIFDPEGYPDNHSALDAPSGSNNATLAAYATYWSAMLTGWSAGMKSIDPSLNAGVYATQSEYRNYGLVNQPLPVFEALAFSSNGPVQITGSSGTNIRGYIAFGASCTPASTLASEVRTLVNPPWSGAFNTLQFNASVYCAPPSS